MLAEAYSDLKQKQHRAPQAGYVRITAYDPPEEETARTPVIETVEELQRRGYAPGDIAVLVRTNAQGVAVARQLLDYKASRPDTPYCYDVVTQEALQIGNSDTVGFIRKLPTHLIEAFKATLEELSYADVLLHVIDISNPEWEAQARVVDGLISQLGASETPCLRVFNKCDAYIGILPHGDDIVCISARSGEGADALVSKLLEMLDRGKKQVRLEIPYSDAGIVDLLKREAAVLSMEYTGITAEAIVTPDVLGRVKKYIPGYVEPKEDWE